MKYPLLIISIIESIYIYYMFCCFETDIDFNIFASPSHYWFKHLVGNEKGLRICLFGQKITPLIIFILIIRNFIIIPKNYFMGFIIFSMIFSLINFNAFAYLLPIFILEILIIFSTK